MAAPTAPVDTSSISMAEAGDKMATNGETSSPKGRSKKAGPFLKVKAGSAVVPIYRTESKGRVRFTLSYYRDGRRMRKMFNTMEDAKKEALFVAQRIQSGMQHVTDLKPHERDSFKAVEALLEKLGIPLYAAVEDYVRARSLAGSESLSVMATEYSKMFGNIVRRATVPEVVAELLKIREQDGASDAYLGQLRTTLNRLADKFPGPILEVTGPDVDAWLRSLDIVAVTRNSMLRCIKVLFSFAKAQNYLPDEKNTAVEQIHQVRVKSDDTTIFSPAEMEKLLHHAPPDLVPILAIGAFAGIRMAELQRLDWKAVDLDRKFIEVRAGQAKTASRRVIPISDNLAAWLTPLERKGKIVRTKELQTHVPALARVLKMEWPRNVLRDSFISYRIAIVQSADQVALEAGNSPSIIFKHYRELTTPEVAEKWFSILPKDGQWENTLRYDRKKRRMILNGVETK
ncbi:MAG: tyrosine-type recombinase/integrase [Luteolibacter sp.]